MQHLTAVLNENPWTGSSANDKDEVVSFTVDEPVTAPPPSAAPTSNTQPSVTDRLKKLEQLRSEGLVTDEECEVKRKEILQDL